MDQPEQDGGREGLDLIGECPPGDEEGDARSRSRLRTMMADDLQARAGGVAPNYAVSVEGTTIESVEVIEISDATEPK